MDRSVQGEINHTILQLSTYVTTYMYGSKTSHAAITCVLRGNHVDRTK